MRRIDLSSGVITRVAGTGTAGYSGDGGQATQARLSGPQRIQIDSVGNLYIADTLNHAVRRVDAGTGIITTIAGTGVQGFSGDGGPATAARFNTPRGLALDGDTVLFIADSNNHRVRRLDLVTGVVTTVAGTSRGYAGDGGPARLAKLYQPRGLTVTPQGGLVIADSFNSALRMVEGGPPAASTAVADTMAEGVAFTDPRDSVSTSAPGGATAGPSHIINERELHEMIGGCWCHPTRVRWDEQAQQWVAVGD